MCNVVRLKVRDLQGYLIWTVERIRGYPIFLSERIEAEKERILDLAIGEFELW